MKNKILTVLTVLGLTAVAPAAFANDNAAAASEKHEVVVEIKDHKFTPAEIKVPAGKEFVLHVKNNDATPEEFESKPLKIEKVIAGNKEAKIHVRALEKGNYPFVGEFHEDVAKGNIIAE